VDKPLHLNEVALAEPGVTVSMATQESIVSRIFPESSDILGQGGAQQPAPESGFGVGSKCISPVTCRFRNCS
jgi:hypothetical protein